MQSRRRQSGRRGFRIRELFPTPGTLLTLQRPENLWRGVTLTLLVIPYAGLCALSYELIHAGWPKPLWIVYMVALICGLFFIFNGLVCAIRLIPYYLIQRPRARRRAAAETAAMAAQAEQEAAAANAVMDNPVESVPEEDGAVGSSTPLCEQCGAATVAEPFAAEHEVHTAYMCPNHGLHSVVPLASHN